MCAAKSMDFSVEIDRKQSPLDCASFPLCFTLILIDTFMYFWGYYVCWNENQIKQNKTHFAQLASDGFSSIIAICIVIIIIIIKVCVEVCNITKACATEQLMNEWNIIYNFWPFQYGCLWMWIRYCRWKLR